MYPVRKSAKSKLSLVLTFVLFFCVNVLCVCGSEEKTTIVPTPSDGDGGSTKSKTAAEIAAEKQLENSIDALAHRMLGEDINISLELPRSTHRLVIEGGDSKPSPAEDTILADESKQSFTVWNYKPKSSVEHVTTADPNKYKLKPSFQISRYQNKLNLKAAASAGVKKEAGAGSRSDVGAGAGSGSDANTGGNYPDDFFGPNPVQNGVGKKPEPSTAASTSRETLTPATDRAYGKFGQVWKKRPIIPLITKHTTIVAPHHPHDNHIHHHHHPHGWGWKRGRKRPHKNRRPRYRHYGRPKRYRHARRYRPHRHYRHHRHQHGWHHGHKHSHGHGHGHGWKSNEDYHSGMPSYAPAYISYGPFYKLPPGIKLDNPAYVAPATPAETASSYTRSHTKYTSEADGLGHMDTPHIVDNPSHVTHKEYPNHSHNSKHYHHSVNHFDDHGHNSIEYAPTVFEEHSPPYEDHFSHSHSHDNPKHIPYRHHSYGRELDHDRPRYRDRHRHHHPMDDHHHHHHPPHPHHHDHDHDHHSHEFYSHEVPFGTPIASDAHSYINDPPPPHFFSRDNRLKNKIPHKQHDGPNVPGYGTPEAAKNYDPPMNFGHPMHNFGPPMSSFGQPSPTFGPALGDDPLGPRDSYFPTKEPTEGKSGPSFGNKPEQGHRSNSLIGPGAPEDFPGPPNFFDKPFKHLIASTNNFNENKPRRRPPGFQKNENMFKKKKNFYFNPYPNTPSPMITTLPPLIAYEDNANSFSHKTPNGQVPNPDFSKGFRPSKLIQPFPPQQHSSPGQNPNGRPPPNFDTNYNSPGMSKDHKFTDWFHFAKRNRQEKILLGYPLADTKKTTKFSTIPEPFKPFVPDPIHRKLPKLTWDNMTKRVSMPRSGRRRYFVKRPRHRDLLTKDTQDSQLPTSENSSTNTAAEDSNSKSEQEAESNVNFDSTRPQSQDVPLTVKSEQGFKDMIQAHKKLIVS